LATSAPSEAASSDVRALAVLFQLFGRQFGVALRLFRDTGGKSLNLADRNCTCLPQNLDRVLGILMNFFNRFLGRLDQSYGGISADLLECRLLGGVTLREDGLVLAVFDGAASLTWLGEERGGIGSRRFLYCHPGAPADSSSGCLRIVILRPSPCQVDAIPSPKGKGKRFTPFFNVALPSWDGPECLAKPHLCVTFDAVPNRR